MRIDRLVVISTAFIVECNPKLKEIILSTFKIILFRRERNRDTQTENDFYFQHTQMHTQARHNSILSIYGLEL